MKTSTYEHGFMLSLLILAVGSLIWLFTPFIPALFLALLISITTFNQYKKYQQTLSNTNAALLMTLLVTLLLIFPLSYVLLMSGIKVSALIETINTDFTIETSRQILSQIINGLPFSESINGALNAAVDSNLESILITIKNFSITLLGSIVSLSSNFIFFLIITVFALYYFYIDGKNAMQKLKDLLPLEKQLNDILFKQFAGLSTTLVGSVLAIAVLQGMVFSIGVIIVGLPALYFGVAMALASFIPVLGGLIIWLPLSLYLYAQDAIIDALIVVFFGGILVGLVIDNFIRPMIIQRLSKSTDLSNALNHTFIAMLSTLAGIIQFGILGLLIGPIMAAMAISIFDTYALKYAKPFNKS